MSNSIYTASANDTFDRVARIVYFDDSKAFLVRQANPSVTEPINAGTVLYIPQDLSAPAIVQTGVTAAEANQVTITIDGQDFKWWNDITLDLRLDSIDTFSFNTPFDSSDLDFRERFRPLSFAGVTISIGGVPTINGTMLTVRPQVTPDESTALIEGYSLPGVLMDSTAPISLFPVEFNNVTLQQVATKLLQPFSIQPVFEVSSGPVFDRITLQPSENILQFLIGLAKQRNMIVGNDANGRLIFFRSESPVNMGTLHQGAQPLIGITPQFNPQAYHSHITGMSQSTATTTGQASTVVNPHLQTSIRPLNFAGNDTENANIKSAAEARAGRMFADAVNYTAQVEGWRNADGEVWSPGKTLSVLAPDAMIYTETELLIRSVSLSRSKELGDRASIDLILPEAFRGEIPETLPWD